MRVLLQTVHDVILGGDVSLLAEGSVEGSSKRRCHYYFCHVDGVCDVAAIMHHFSLVR